MKKSTQVLVPVIVSFVVAFVLGYLLGKFGLPSWWKSLLLNVAGSIIALILLYGVYILCSVWASRDKACPELWWIPKFNCFRYVIRNNPGYDITDIHSRAWLRDIVPKGEGCGENSFREFAVVMGNRVMIPKGDDYVLVSFRLAEGEDSGLVFVLTDKFGANPDPHRLSEEFQEFLVEYSAKIQTGWLLKYEISRTYVIPKFHEIHGSLFQVLLAIQEENEEAPFPFLSWRTRVIRVSI